MSPAIRQRQFYERSETRRVASLVYTARPRAENILGTKIGIVEFNEHEQPASINQATNQLVA